MTREEARRILLDGLINAPSVHEWCMAFNMAIKALEQTDVLDKIRAEIEAIAINGQVDANTMFIRAGGQVKQMALEIIDKYRKEEKQ